jgi:hypothetical protein
MTNQATASAPLMFKKPTLLLAEQHSGFGFKPIDSFMYASNTNAIPLSMPEFEKAAISYPIVFTNGDRPTALAVTGLTANKNNFVDADGAWLAGEYIPAYVRKYPFVFMESDDGEQFSLCIEDEYLVESGGQPIFDNEKPTSETQTALDFCKNFQASWQQTEQYVKILQELDLLIERRADIETQGGDRLSLDGFCVVDRDKYVNMPKSAVNELPRDLVAAITCHFVSMSCWARLLTISEKG